MSIDLTKLTIKSTHDHLSKGDFSATDLAKSYLKNIEEKNTDINSYLEVFDDVLNQAEVADDIIKKGDSHILTGVPVAVKDNILIKGRRASAASCMLEGYKAVYDATVIEKLKNRSAVFLGRTNMDEFAMGSSTENSAFGVTKNPHSLSHVVGGSSGGSAAALAMDGALGSIGSDTGGSIRQPAAFCGVVGLKPTYGAVSRYGLMSMASSLDQVGTFGKTVEDAELLFDAVKGYDDMDSTSVPDNIKSVIGEPNNNKLTIGVPTEFISGVDPDVLQNFNDSLDALRADGHEVIDIKLDNMKYSLAVYYIVMPAEVSSNLARFDGVRYGLYKEGKDIIDNYSKSRGAGFGVEVERRILLGTYVLSSGYSDAYYNKANMLRRVITTEFENIFKEVDVIATPTTTTPAFKIGEKKDDPLQMYLADIFTVPANIAGLPSISVPSGFAKREDKDLPIGIQFMAPAFGEKLLFQAGKNIEKLLG